MNVLLQKRRFQDCFSEMPLKQIKNIVLQMLEVDGLENCGRLCEPYYVCIAFEVCVLFTGRKVVGCRKNQVDLSGEDVATYDFTQRRFFARPDHVERLLRGCREGEHDNVFLRFCSRRHGNVAFAMKM